MIMMLCTLQANALPALPDTSLLGRKENGNFETKLDASEAQESSRHSLNFPSFQKSTHGEHLHCTKSASYHQPFGLGPPRPPPPVAAIISLISSLVTYSVPMTTSSQVTTFRFFSIERREHLLLLLLPYSNYFSSSPKMRL